MLRKSMIALCAVASIAALTPDLALARGGGGHGGGGGGHGGGGFGGHSGFSSGFGGARVSNFSGSGVRSGGFVNSFARAAPVGAAGIAAVQGGHFAGGQFNHRGFHHGFHHGRRFFGGGFVGYDGDYWDVPAYAYDDSYVDDGSCYIVQQRVLTRYGWRVRPIQVCG